MNELVIATIQGTGLPQIFLRKMDEQGIVAQEVREVLVQRKLKRQRETVPPVYDSSTKLVEQPLLSEDVNLVVAHYQEEQRYQEERRRLNVKA